MEAWDKIWNLHRDRPPIFLKVQDACATLVRNRHHEDVPHKKLVQAYLTVLEYCGDFQCQLHVLNMIINDGRVQHYNDWFAAAWFMGRPKTLNAFLHLLGSKLTCSDFLKIYNNELEFQFLYSAQCAVVRWKDELLSNDQLVWLHLNCGTKTMSITGLQGVPTEFKAQGLFVLRSSEIKKVKVLNLETAHGFGKLQGIEILTSKGHLFVQTHPHIVDWTMFTNFVNFISKIQVEFQSFEKEGSDLTDFNGNKPLESRSDFGQSFNFIQNPNEDAILLQPVVQNSVFQVSSSQDALKTLAINSDSNDIEICHHYKRVSNESCNDSDTADESHDQINVPIDKFLKNDCEVENHTEVNCSLEGTDNCKESQQLDLSNSQMAHSQEDNNSLKLLDTELKMPQNTDLDAENKPNTEEDNTVSHLIAAVDNDAPVTEIADLKTKPKKGRRKIPIKLQRKPSPISLKAGGEGHDESEKSDNDHMELMGTPRRMTRRYTQHIKEAMLSDGDSEFKTPSELPIAVSRKKYIRKRKSNDGTNKIPEVETSTTSAILLSQPAAEETTETSLSKLAKPSSVDETGVLSAVNEILESTLPPKVPHPDSMPTLNTPIATPVREPEDSLIQPDFGNIHNKLNDDLKSDTSKEETTCMPPVPPAFPSYMLPGPPPPVPLHVNLSQRSSAYRDYNMCLPPKHRRYDDDDDLKSENGDVWDISVMDSSSDTSYLDNAGSAVLLPADDGGFSSTPCTLKETVPIGDMNNLQQFSEICSHVESTDEPQ